MYTVLWTDADGNDRWDRCESRADVVRLLVANGIQDDEDVLIFTPDAEDFTMTSEDIFASL